MHVLDTTLPEFRTVYKALHRPLTLCGVDRRLFFLALLVGVAAFNLFYSFLAGCLLFVALYLGALLRLPGWLVDLSPVGQTTAPSNYPVLALTVMVVVAAALTLLAGAIYRHRDAA